MIRSSSASSAIRVILRGGSRGGVGDRCSLLSTNGASSASVIESRNSNSLVFSTRQYSSSFTTSNNGQLSKQQQQQKEEQIRKSIFSAALQHVHDMGWTDDAIASGVLDCNYPPSYIGRVLLSSSHQSSLSENTNNDSGGENNMPSSSSSSGVWGNGQLVAHFMEECNNKLRDKLLSSTTTTTTVVVPGGQELSSYINTALQLRLSMVLPYIHSKRWHEGMAIGALPQNAIMTMNQLNDMADIVLLSYATGGGGGGEDNKYNNSSINNSSMHKVAIVAAYAAAELHLLSSNVVTTETTTTSLSGDRHDDTWTFLEARSTEAAHVIISGGIASLPLFDNHLLLQQMPNIDAITFKAAGAMTSSLLGALLSLATPSAASMIGRVGGSSTVVLLPQMLDSVLGLVQSFVGTGTTMTQMMNNANSNNHGGVGVDSMVRRGGSVGNKTKGDGTRPSDYATIEEALPPFDTKEEIFGTIQKDIK